METGCFTFPKYSTELALGLNTTNVNALLDRVARMRLGRWMEEGEIEGRVREAPAAIAGHRSQQSCRSQTMKRPFDNIERRSCLSSMGGMNEPLR